MLNWILRNGQHKQFALFIASLDRCSCINWNKTKHFRLVLQFAILFLFFTFSEISNIFTKALGQKKKLLKNQNSVKGRFYCLCFEARENELHCDACVIIINDTFFAAKWFFLLI